MHIVSNTSPVSNLAIVGRLDLLRAKFGRVTIPSAVAFELSRLSHPGGAAAVQSALAAGWLVIASVPDRVPCYQCCGRAWTKAKRRPSNSHVRHMQIC